MYRLLIVDDEPLIVESLYQFFCEHNRPDLDICKAYSGMEAIEILKITKIDVVLTDIRMPGLSGIQLLETISEYWPSCRVILLTGYSDFDSVYTAIHKPRVDYILKTEGYEVVAQTVWRMLDETRQEDEQKTILDDFQKQLEIAVSSMKREFLRDLLFDDQMPTDDIEQCFGKLGIDLDPKRPVLLLLGKLYLPENKAYDEKKQILLDISEIFSLNLGRLLYQSYTVFGDMPIWLIQPKNSDSTVLPDWGGFIARVKANMEFVQNTINERLGLSTVFIISGEPMGYESLKEGFASMSALIAKAFAEHYEMMIVGGKKAEDVLLNAKGGDKKNTSSRIVRKINDYITRNLNNELSLVKIAESVYFNPSYLSRFYKQATGKNLFDYINEIKFEKARQLLKNPCLKINEIGCMVGFKSPSYFTLLFKRMHGLTPEEYRAGLLPDETKVNE
jgi:two-component system response regulator YesN